MADLTIADVRQQYPQYSDMSDTQLADALHSKFYSDLPRDQFDAKIGLAKPETAQAGAEESSTAGDIAKSLGSGLVRGVVGLGMLPGDIAELGTKGINYAFGTDLKNKVPLATSEMALKQLPELHQPQGTAGEYAQTIGEFAPGLLLPGRTAKTLAGKAATQVLAPAIASESLGQAAKGTAAEPVARFAGAVVGGGAGIRRAATAARSAEPSLEDIKQAGVEALKSPAVQDVRFDPIVADTISNHAIAALRQQRFNDTNAAKTFSVLEDLKTPVGPAQEMNLGTAFNPPVKASEALAGGTAEHTYEDFQAARRRLSDLAGKGGEESAAATQAIGIIDESLKAVPQGALRAGNIDTMNTALERGRADYSSAMTGGRVVEKLRNAELQAASANSGANVENATRQKLRPLLTTKKGQRGFTDEEQAAIEATVRGSPLGNALRTGGNYLGGGGGLGAMISSGAGFIGTGGNPLGLAAPLAGMAMKKVGGALQRRQTQKILEQIKSRSPTFQDYLASASPKPGLLPAQAWQLGLLGQTPSRRGGLE